MDTKFLSEPHLLREHLASFINFARYHEHALTPRLTSLDSSPSELLSGDHHIPKGNS